MHASIRIGLIATIFLPLSLPGVVRADTPKKGAAVVASSSPRTRQVAPAFTLTDLQGRKQALKAFRGWPVPLFFFCGCKWCHECAETWGQMQRGDALPKPPAGRSRALTTLVVFIGNAEEAKSFAGEVGMEEGKTLFLPNPKMDVTLAYHALPCPRVFIVDAQGTIRYRNDHADDAPQKAPATTILSRAISALQRCVTEAGKTSRPQGKPKSRADEKRGARHGKH